MQLVINDKTYNFKAGFGFIRRANKRTVVEASGIKKEVGLNMLITEILQGDVIALADALDLMNEGLVPRLEKGELETYLESLEDLEDLFRRVTDFFMLSNCTARTLKECKKNLEEQVKNN